MTIEWYILIALTVASVVSVFYIPKSRHRFAFISFHAFQALTWAAIIILMQIGSLEFPVREFPRATKGGFLTDFLFLPMIYTWSVLLSQNIVSITRKIVHYLVFISIMVWFINFISTYTQLQNFTNGTLVSRTIQLYAEFSVQFIICNTYVSWFFKTENLSKGG